MGWGIFGISLGEVLLRPAAAAADGEAIWTGKEERRGEDAAAAATGGIRLFF